MSRVSWSVVSFRCGGIDPYTGGCLDLTLPLPDSTGNTISEHDWVGAVRMPHPSYLVPVEPLNCAALTKVTPLMLPKHPLACNYDVT